MNVNVDVNSPLTKVFALNYFRRDYKSAKAFMDKMWMDLRRDGFKVEFVGFEIGFGAGISSNLN